MAGRFEQDARRFRPAIFDVGRHAVAAEKFVQLRGDDRLSGHRLRRAGVCARGHRGRGKGGGEKREQRGHDHRHPPGDQAMHPVAEFHLPAIEIERRAQPAGNVAAQAERHQRDKQKIKSAHQPQPGRGFAPGRRGRGHRQPDSGSECVERKRKARRPRRAREYRRPLHRTDGPDRRLGDRAHVSGYR